MSDNKAISEELAELRGLLEKLEQQRVENEAATQAQREAEAKNQNAALETNAAESEDDLNVPPELLSWISEEGLDMDVIKEKFGVATREWFDTLNSDLRDTKPSTLLMVFIMGVAVGRFSR